MLDEMLDAFAPALKECQTFTIEKNGRPPFVAKARGYYSNLHLLLHRSNDPHARVSDM